MKGNSEFLAADPLRGVDVVTGGGTDDPPTDCQWISAIEAVEEGFIGGRSGAVAAVVA